MPVPPNAHASAVLALTAVALVLFSRDRIPLETSSLLVLALLAVGFQVAPFDTGAGWVRATDFFHGFGHEALVAVCGLMVMGQGLVRTGALEPVGRSLARLWRLSPSLSLLATLAVAATLSAFINNTPIVVLLLPVLASVSLRTGAPPSGMLMPMGFATLVGGTGTTIGTSTNLLVVAIAADLGLRRLEMFDFVVPAAIAGSAGIAYLWLVAPRLLPRREPPLTNTSPRLFAAELRILEDSAADGLTLAEAIKRTGGRMKVSRIKRGEQVDLVPLPDVRLRAGDRLALNDMPTQLKTYEGELGGALYTGGTRVDEEHPLEAGNQQMAEVAIVRGSPAEGLSLRIARFIDRYQLVPLALHRAGREVWRSSAIEDVVLRAGDVLLVQGPEEQIRAMKAEKSLLVLDATADLPHTTKAPLALLIMAIVVALAGSGVLPIATSSICGALALIATGCLSWQEATRALSVQVILIVVASLALGSALLHTGGTDYLTEVFLAVTAGQSAALTLSGLMLLMAILTNVVSNNAAAVIGAPVAIGIASRLSLPPEPFVLAVLFGANLSYATPMAYKTNLLVMTAGGYRFSDFVRIGVPLIALMWLILSWVLPQLYDL
jgi:di/tricarboxylate transporter